MAQVEWTIDAKTASFLQAVQKAAAAYGEVGTAAEKAGAKSQQSAQVAKKGNDDLAASVVGLNMNWLKTLTIVGAIGIAGSAAARGIQIGMRLVNAEIDELMKRLDDAREKFLDLKDAAMGDTEVLAEFADKLPLHGSGLTEKEKARFLRGAKRANADLSADAALAMMDTAAPLKNIVPDLNAFGRGMTELKKTFSDASDADLADMTLLATKAGVEDFSQFGKIFEMAQGTDVSKEKLFSMVVASQKTNQGTAPIEAWLKMEEQRRNYVPQQAEVDLAASAAAGSIVFKPSTPPDFSLPKDQQLSFSRIEKEAAKMGDLVGRARKEDVAGGAFRSFVSHPGFARKQALSEEEARTSQLNALQEPRAEMMALAQAQIENQMRSMGGPLATAPAIALGRTYAGAAYTDTAQAVATGLAQFPEWTAFGGIGRGLQREFAGIQNRAEGAITAVQLNGGALTLLERIEANTRAAAGAGAGPPRGTVVMTSE